VSTITITADADTLAELARIEAERHAPGTAERRAAAHLWAALITSPTVDAARRANGTFGAGHVGNDTQCRNP
jgi:hypothetical protein